MKRICQRLIILQLLLMGFATWSSAQTASSDYEIIQEKDTIWNFGYKGVNLFSRQMHRVDIAYTSKNLKGEDIKLSGYVCIPGDIYDGSQPCDGILLYNHYTQIGKAQAPTRGYSVGEDMVMANPLKPNYIVVCSDFIGFGIDESNPQVYCFNEINGQASIDCLLAARKLLDDRSISQGKFLLNAGYSSGGFDALATQKVRDMNTDYREAINFDKTLVGGMPFDMMKGYDAFIDKKDEASYDPTCLPMILDTYNRNANVGYTYDQLFKEPLASNYEEWFVSGKYSTSEIMDKFKGYRISDVVQEKFLNRSSDEYKKMKEVAKVYALETNWVPDSTQRYYSMHLVRDSVVPTPSGRAFINFLNNYRYDGKKCQGYEKSIVPERTRLQTNYFLPLSQHTIVGGVVYYLNLAATLTAYPVLFYDGELNTHYADLVEPATLMGIIKLLESKGYDVKGIVKKLSGEGGGGSIFEVLIKLNETLKNIGTSAEEVLQILDDSGVTLSDIIAAYTYLTTEDPKTEARSFEATAGVSDSAAEKQQTIEPLVIDYYQQSLYKWLKDNNVDIFAVEER